MPLQFDAAQMVPDAYDVFCEGCGYSLAGLTGNRCPECGNIFNPNELPFARVPWLHRKRLGRWRAYWKTVAMASFSPGKFARELCRPVRISVKDAQSFRRTTLWLATISIVVAVSAAPLIAALWLAVPRWWLMWRWWQVHALPTISLLLLNIAAAIAALQLFLRLMTDMPLFIWKGLPSLPPSQLAPVHHYACAPLAFVAIGAVIGAALVFRLIVAFPLAANEAPFVLGSCAVAVVFAIWLWVVALGMMKSSSGASSRRLVAMAIYLPIHWLLAFALASLGMAAFEFLETLVLAALRIRM